MKITPKKQETRKFQVGGAMPTGTPAEAPTAEGQTPVDQPAPELGGELDPIMMLAQMAAQALLNQDCNMMAQVCLAFLEIVLQMLGGAPEEPLGEPVFRKGGTLSRRIKK